LLEEAGAHIDRRAPHSLFRSTRPAISGLMIWNYGTTTLASILKMPIQAPCVTMVTC